MKIYHTETQADYDALMVELEARGCVWSFGRKLSESNIWHVSEHLTCIRVYDSEVDYASLNYYKEEYSHIPITKYKAKAEDKMKFTKDNAWRKVEERLNESQTTQEELRDRIYELDDTPEKVVVPKFVAEWIEWNKEIGVSIQVMLKCYERFYVNRNPNGQTDGEKAVNWYVDNPYKFIQAYEDGYTIEPEQLYYIPLPHLETADGLQQVLSKRENGENYFASRPNESLKQRFTKEEIERVPEIYKPYAKPIEEESE